MHEGDLEPEQPPARLVVDQLGALLGEIRKRRANVVHLVGKVVHSRASLRKEAPDRRIGAERREELDTALADANRRSFDALRFDALAMLELAAE